VAVKSLIASFLTDKLEDRRGGFVSPPEVILSRENVKAVGAGVAAHC
jgi:hypothetical protein